MNSLQPRPNCVARGGWEPSFADTGFESDGGLDEPFPRRARRSEGGLDRSPGRSVIDAHEPDHDLGEEGTDLLMVFRLPVGIVGSGKSNCSKRV